MSCKSSNSARVLATLLATLTLGAPASACPAPPPAIVDLDIPRFYADAKGSVVDAARLAAHDAATAPLTAFLREVTSNADKSFTRHSEQSRHEAAQCALAWLEAWARAGALLGRMAQAQADYQRKWDLAGTALAYLKVRRFATASDRAVIEPWLERLADAARAFFDDRERKRNNHWYWLGLGLAATALATDSDRHWAMARAIYEDAARDISPDGTLPMELERGARALHYHAFAAMPLVVMAELAAARGEDCYAAVGAALHRLVATTARGLAEPAIFDRLAGIAQERPVKPGAGWIQLYAARFPERAEAWGQTHGSDPVARHRWLGGDVTVLARVLREWPH